MEKDNQKEEKTYLDYGQLKMEYSLSELDKAMKSKDILCGLAVKGNIKKGIIVKLNNNTMGLIPVDELIWNRESDKVNKNDISGKIGKNLYFIVKEKIHNKEGNWQYEYILSRKDAQLKFIEEFKSTHTIGDIIEGVIVNNEGYGSFIDIGCGVTGLLMISDICISHTIDIHNIMRLNTRIPVIYKGIDKDNKIKLSHKELLGTWNENIADIDINDIITGIVTRVETYGIFIEITKNLTALAEVKEGVHIGDKVKIAVKGIRKDQGKLKVYILDKLGTECESELGFRYFKTIEDKHIDNWVYLDCENKQIKTKFNGLI